MEVPEIYIDPAVKNDSNEVRRIRKRKSDDVHGGSADVEGKSEADGSDSSLSDSESDETDDDVISFSTLQKQKNLTALTVWGKNSGFSVVPHGQILQLLYDKAAEISRRGQDAPRGVAVTFSKLNSWNKSSWLYFERKWWTSLNMAVESGSYSKIISLIDLDLHTDIQNDLGLTSDQFFACSDIEFLRLAHGWFGPTNNEQAKALLDYHQCRDNGNGNPSSFLKTLSTYNTAVLRTLDLEIAPSIGKWPKKNEPKHGPLTLKSIRASFKNGFSADKAISVACKHCFNVCEQNPKWSHSKLYRELRDHFLEDERALSRATMSSGKRGFSTSIEFEERSQNKRQRGDGSRPQSDRKSVV